jgi:hypothetical protein
MRLSGDNVARRDLFSLATFGKSRVGGNPPLRCIFNDYWKIDHCSIQYLDFLALPIGAVVNFPMVKFPTGKYEPRSCQGPQSLIYLLDQGFLTYGS